MENQGRVNFSWKIQNQQKGGLWAWSSWTLDPKTGDMVGVGRKDCGPPLTPILRQWQNLGLMMQMPPPLSCRQPHPRLS